MAYCTEQDLIRTRGEEALLQIADPEDTGTPDPDLIVESIEYADRKINRYVGGRKSLPLDPDDINDIACSLALFWLHRRTGLIPEDVRADYKDAIAELEKIASGKIGVVDSAGSTAPGKPGAEMISGGRVFGRDSDAFI